MFHLTWLIKGWLHIRRQVCHTARLSWLRTPNGSGACARYNDLGMYVHALDSSDWWEKKINHQRKTNRNKVYSSRNLFTFTWKFINYFFKYLIQRKRDNNDNERGILKKIWTFFIPIKFSFQKDSISIIFIYLNMQFLTIHINI